MIFITSLLQKDFVENSLTFSNVLTRSIFIFEVYILSMTEKLKQVYKGRYWQLLKNKYILACLALALWVGVFDENNLVERFQMKKELNKLEADKAYYLELIEKDAARLEELRTNNENLEKFAREQYLMKKDNEDVFIIVRE